MKYLEKAREYGRSYASSMFATFLNPKCRGPKFTWDGFPELAGSLAKTSVYNAYEDLVFYDKYEQKITKEAYNAAYYEARNLLKQSNILEWWENEKE